MEYEDAQGPPKVTLAVLGVIALIIPILVAGFLVYKLAPAASITTSFTNTGSIKPVTILLPSGVGTNQSLNYSPADITVVVGVNNSILWVDNDPIPHTVTSTSVPSGAQGFDSKTINQGDNFPVTLTVPGEYDYHCSFHPGWMVGKIMVKGGTGTQVSNSTVTGSSGSAGGVTVTLPNGVGTNTSLNFAPASITVVVGVNNTVTWVDRDPVPHTVTSVSVPGGATAFDSNTLQQGQNFQYTFSVPGTYKYHCTFHPGYMIGAVIVKPSS